MSIKEGDVVCVHEDSTYQLASGCSRYTQAIVLSMNPFVLVSGEGDMRWAATVRVEDFKFVRTATDEELAKVSHRNGG